MDNTNRIPRLFVWSLATFHTALFFAAVFTLLYLRGGLGALLASLNTLIGVAVFGAFWLTTWWSTRQGLRGVAWSTIENPLACRGASGNALASSFVWGAVNGMLFLAALIAIFVPVALIAISTTGSLSQLSLVPIVLIGVVLFGFPIAAVIGGVFGFLLAVIDGILIVVTHLVFDALTSGRGPDSETASVEMSHVTS